MERVTLLVPERRDRRDDARAPARPARGRRRRPTAPPAPRRRRPTTRRRASATRSRARAATSCARRGSSASAATRSATACAGSASSGPTLDELRAPRRRRARGARAPAPAPPRPRRGEPSWEQKPVAVLADRPRAARRRRYEPWTARGAGQRDDRGARRGLRRRLRGALAVAPDGRLRRPARARAAPAARRAGGARDPARWSAQRRAGPRPELRMAVHVGDGARRRARAPIRLARCFPSATRSRSRSASSATPAPGEILVSPPVGAPGRARRASSEPRALRSADDATIGCTRTPSSAARGRAPATARRAARATRFVGRERELDLLRDASTRAGGGHGQVVFVVGEAGIGKSRLLAEFRRRLADAPHVWIEGRCASYGTTTAFLPIVDGLRRCLGHRRPRRRGARAAPRSTRAVAALGDDLAWTLPFVRQVLGLAAGDAGVARARLGEPAQRDLPRPEGAHAARRGARAARPRGRGPALDRSGVGGVPRLHRRRRPDDARAARAARTARATAIRSATAATTCASRCAPLSRARDGRRSPGSLLGDRRGARRACAR